MMLAFTVIVKRIFQTLSYSRKQNGVFPYMYFSLIPCVNKQSLNCAEYNVLSLRKRTEDMISDLLLESQFEILLQSIHHTVITLANP